MTNRKTKGSNAERKIVREINELGCDYKVGSSRLLSKYMDDQGVDIVDFPDAEKKFPFHIQSKSYSKFFDYNELFQKFKLKDKPLIVLHEVTEKRGTRFFKLDDYFIIKKSDFYDLIKKLNKDE